ncbi:cytochrome P450 [Pseudonocardia eucalypti]|nr:cytochrome P450 [Pseudonocardia eucalypti]
MELGAFDGNYVIDPAATWRELLAGPDRAHFAEDLGLWLIWRHEDVRRALADGERFKNALTLTPLFELCPAAMDVAMRIDAPATTAAADAPVHTRTRKALRATFATTAKGVAEQYLEVIDRRVDELVGRLADRAGAEVDLVPAFTSELPLLVLVDLLGVPERDIPLIRNWADGQIALVWGRPSPADQERLAGGLLDFWRYCRSLVTRRLDEPAAGRPDDFLGRVLRYRGGADAVLSIDEVASFAFNLLVAGHETTAGLLAHGIDHALSRPELWGRIARDPGHVPALVEETLRFTPPIDGWLRVTSAPVELGPVTIPAGARCLLLLGAANRDPAVFGQPDLLDTDRPDAREHLSFGHGAHFCVGAALARLEAERALTALARAFPDLRLAAGHTRSFHPNAGFRAHRDLRVAIQAIA